MAYTFVKFPRDFFSSKEWLKPRKYTKAEALLYLLNEANRPPLRKLADIFQWEVYSVHRFIKEAENKGYLQQKCNKNATERSMKINELQESVQQKCNKNATHLIENNNYPPILSSTKVESNIIPPKGERDFLQELDGEYQDIVREWLSYKRERKESYKSIRSMQAFVAKLTKLSNGNPKIAREIINQSIANNWAGIFQLKIDQRNDDNKSHTNRSSSTVFIGNGYGQSTI